MHFGLGPIGAAIVKQMASSAGIQDRRRHRHRSGEGRTRPRRRRRACRDGSASRCQDDAAKALQGGRARRRRPVHELVDQEACCRRSKPSSRRRRRSSRRPRSSPIPATRTSGRRGRFTRGRRRRRWRVLAHRRQPRVRDGCAADRADRRLRTGRSRHRQPRAGRAHPAAAVPAEDRRRTDHRAVPAARSTTAAVRHVGLTESIAMIADALGWTLDRITDEIAAEARDGDDLERVPRGRSRVCVRHHPGRRRLSEERAGRSGCTWRRISARPNRTTRSRSKDRRALSMKIAGGIHGDIATASIVVNSIPKVLAAAPGSAHDARPAAAVVLSGEIGSTVHS